VEAYLELPSPFLAEVRDPKERATRQEILRERAGLIEKRLFNVELRARYLIKASSKHPRLKGSSWEVAKKLSLSTKEESFYPYATLSLATIRPEADMGWFAFFLPEPIGSTEYVAFDCDEGDLDDLIQILQEAKTALRNARKGA
jgi:hypothetical protein